MKDDSIGEIVQLITELNEHRDLTVKLNNQAKICSIFGGSKPLNKMKMDLKNLDPKVKQILQECHKKLEQL